jgi:hypothetical protein
VSHSLVVYDDDGGVVALPTSIEFDKETLTLKSTGVIGVVASKQYTFHLEPILAHQAL